MEGEPGGRRVAGMPVEAAGLECAGDELDGLSAGQNLAGPGEIGASMTIGGSTLMGGARPAD